MTTGFDSETVEARGTKEPLVCQRDRFSLPAGQHYLNCAYMAPLSRAVQEAGAEGIRLEAVPARIHAEDFFSGCNTLRARFAELIGLREPEHVAIIPAVSYGIASVAKNTTLARGQNVVTLAEQFPSNAHVWRTHAEQAGADVRVVGAPVEGPGRGEAWNGAILESIDTSTAVVAMGSVHWTDGTPFDLERIGERAREVGAAFVVDGTQSVGAAPFDLDAVRPDALVCAGYKWLMGPYSLGLAYFGERYLEGAPLEEWWASKLGSEDFSALGHQGRAYRRGAVRYDVGEAASFILVPMLTAALEQVLGWGVENVAAYTGGLRDELFASPRLAAKGVDADGGGSAHMFGLHLPEAEDPKRVRAELESRGVHVSVRGRVVRVSPNVYNDQEDLDALLEGLERSIR